MVNRKNAASAPNCGLKRKKNRINILAEQKNRKRILGRSYREREKKTCANFTIHLNRK